MGSLNVDVFTKKDYDKSLIKYRQATDVTQNIAEYIPTMCQDIIDIAEMYKKLVTEYLTSDEWVDQAINIAGTANDTSESLKGTSIRLVTDVKGMMDSIETDNRRLKSTMEDKRNQLDGILNTLTAINPGKVTPPTKSETPTNEEKPTEETPTEEQPPVEETPVEETPVEETPTEETTPTPTEDTPPAETPAEEPPVTPEVETPSTPTGPGIPQIGEDGLVVRTQSQAGQDVINKLYYEIPSHANGTHSSELDAMIDNLSPEECAWVLSRIEDQGFGQTGAGYAGKATPESHANFIQEQVVERFGGDIHELLKHWGTYSYSGY